MDDERLVVEVEKYVELYDQSSRHYKDNSKKVIAWRAIALEIGSSDEAEVKARMVEYTTFQKPFSPEKIAALQEIASVNMRNNKDAIVREIQNAATRRQGRRNVTDSAL
ncbi:unnamed protein product [Boreogadus saida]